MDNIKNLTSDEDFIEINVMSSEDEAVCPILRRSTRKHTPTKTYHDFIVENSRKKSVTTTSPRKRITINQEAIKEQSKEDADTGADADDNGIIYVKMETKKSGRKNVKEIERTQISDQIMIDFNTPKKKSVTSKNAQNSPKTPTRSTATPRINDKLTKTPSTKQLPKSMTNVPKTPSHIRGRMKNEIAKVLEENSSDTDFSSDDSDFEPIQDESSSESDSTESHASSVSDGDIKILPKNRKAQPVCLLPTTPASHIRRKISKSRKSDDYIPEYEKYFKRQSSKKIHTSDHTLDRLKSSRLPSDRLFALLAEMKISNEHETAINNMMMDYKAYFGKWLFILNEGYNLLLYGLGSKRELLQSFHRDVLSEQNVVIINGFFPSLTLKEILESIIKDILEIGHVPTNPHEALAIIENEFSNIPDVHLFIIIHNLDGPTLKNAKAQTILATLASIPNIHILASIDNINTPLLWDHTKLQRYNFSWWDCTTMLPYTEETAFENSLLVQNTGELALSSMRSVFLSLTNNSRGIFMVIVKYQLKHKSIHNYQGMTFRDLYASCREAFLVSSDLALRAQLTEFLDHKLVKLKRGADGSELLNIPIANELLQQFLDEQDK